MSKTIIKVENVSKQYRLGQVGTGSLVHDINRWWHIIRGKGDPYLKIGEANDRAIKGNSDYVWALKDIEFEVKSGDVLGIIGRNGAGKSTLLKILSRTTSPTTGSISINGRIASLLEVGTGFHPELSGRENIYLNGAILGMTRAEIARKFDEIVDFSGVERYIDTPVKRYSSGMYVRLAFAVAAHLEPEILIVDEVLAVGDVEFQKKCLGKMKDVSTNEGRTVLFVSHNMAAISNLCNTGLVMQNGTIKKYGNIEESINFYMQNNKQGRFLYTNINADGKDKIIRIEIDRKSDQANSSFSFDEEIVFTIEISHPSRKEGTYFGLAVLDKWQRKIFTDTYRLQFNKEEVNNSITRIKTSIPSRLLLTGTYSIDAALFVPQLTNFDYISDACNFEIEDLQSELSIYGSADIGNVLVKYKWEVL